ncbi:Calcium homeostasis endoplasmic reticulum protein [Tolypocladium paradoxum]|uniref:Calcium homeostasis endoplasmic reticulum protein n=1 Tax=Tolypocladium paradoxum TaxID=94208 RepID=A0A2S4KLG3_9HYPO|nr:Calcium homeostasis endoplasmic reticulum protein [Tolypocladium paradoxum]
MVATPELASAKAAFTNSLRRYDPSPLTKRDVEEFIQLLDNTLDECSRPNVQKCKNWIIANVVQSSGRAATLGKFLVALSESMELDFDRPSVKRRRLGVLYIVSDVLHHVVVRQRNGWFAEVWGVHLPSMVATASTFEKCPKHLRKVQDLITLWEERGYITPALILRLRDTFTRASDRESGTRVQMSDEALKRAKEAPYTLPPLHGNSKTAWAKLPPACWLAQLAPNSILPLRRAHMLPVQLSTGPANSTLLDVAKAALSDRDQLYQKENLQNKVDSEVNQLGEEKRPGEMARGHADDETYWGWSQPLCGRTTARRNDARDTNAQSANSQSTNAQSTNVQSTDTQSTNSQSANAQSAIAQSAYAQTILQSQQPRPRARSPPPRISRSRSPRSSKRRKLSTRSRSGSRSSSRSPSGLRSRTPSQPRRRDGSDSRSRSPPLRRGRSERRDSESGSWSTRSRSRTPSRSESRPRRSSPGSNRHRDSRVPQQPPTAPPRSIPAMPRQGPGNFQVPIPPPPPPMGYQGTYQGTLPPPPPLPPSLSWTPNQAGFMPHTMGGGWGAVPVPPPPPPPPPPLYSGHQQFNNSWGLGMGRGGGGGRGYRGRGRGNNWPGSTGYGGNGYGGGRGYGGNGYGAR